MTPPKPRMQSQTERDLAGIQARKERDAAPLEVVDESSQAYEDPDARKAFRARRPTEERLTRLETKQDEDRKAHVKLDEKVDVIDVRLARMEGKLDTALGLVPEQHKTERVRIDSRTKLMIAIVGAVGTAIGVVVTALSGCA